MALHTPAPCRLALTLMERDGLTIEEVTELIDEARVEVLAGTSPEEVLQDWFGLEPDYFFDIIPYQWEQPT